MYKVPFSPFPVKAPCIPSLISLPVFLIAATRRDLATKVHFRVQHRDARQGVQEHPASPRCDADIFVEYPCSQNYYVCCEFIMSLRLFGANAQRAPALPPQATAAAAGAEAAAAGAEAAAAAADPAAAQVPAAVHAITVPASAEGGQQHETAAADSAAANVPTGAAANTAAVPASAEGVQQQETAAVGEAPGKLVGQERSDL
eukprot:1156208-Pelagomonas_calceolata.AAC.5